MISITILQPIYWLIAYVGYTGAGKVSYSVYTNTFFGLNSHIRQVFEKFAKTYA